MMFYTIFNQVTQHLCPKLAAPGSQLFTYISLLVFLFPGLCTLLLVPCTLLLAHCTL